MAADARTRLMVALFVDQVESTAPLARLGDIEAEVRSSVEILEGALRGGRSQTSA